MDRHQGITVIRQFLDEALSSAAYGPGTKLPTERAMSERLGVPRSAIRDALSILEAEQRIIRIVGSGTYVASEKQRRAAANGHDLSDTSPAEIMETRLLVEPRIAVLVVANAKAADFERMEECNRNAEAAESFEDFEHWDAALHRAIAEATHNRLIIDIFTTITKARDLAEWGNLKRKSITAERRELYRRDHREIVAALRSRDAKQAEATLLKHLHQVRSNLLGY